MPPKQQLGVPSRYVKRVEKSIHETAPFGMASVRKSKTKAKIIPDKKTVDSNKFNIVKDTPKILQKVASISSFEEIETNFSKVPDYRKQIQKNTEIIREMSSDSLSSFIPYSKKIAKLIISNPIEHKTPNNLLKEQLEMDELRKRVLELEKKEIDYKNQLKRALNPSKEMTKLAPQVVKSSPIVEDSCSDDFFVENMDYKIDISPQSPMKISPQKKESDRIATPINNTKPKAEYTDEISNRLKILSKVFQNPSIVKNKSVQNVDFQDSDSNSDNYTHTIANTMDTKENMKSSIKTNDFSISNLLNRKKEPTENKYATKTGDGKDFQYSKNVNIISAKQRSTYTPPQESSDFEEESENEVKSPVKPQQTITSKAPLPTKPFSTYTPPQESSDLEEESENEVKSPIKPQQTITSKSQVELSINASKDKSPPKSENKNNSRQQISQSKVISLQESSQTSHISIHNDNTLNNYHNYEASDDDSFYSESEIEAKLKEFGVDINDLSDEYSVDISDLDELKMD